MFIKNFQTLESSVLSCDEKLGEYIISRNIPLLSRDGEKYIFAVTDILKEVIELRPKELRKEVYSID